MNAQTAIEIANHCAELVALSARFQALFGRRATVKAGCPNSELDLYHAIFDKQIEIASLLDSSVLRSPGEAFNQWWKRQDVIDLSIASDIHKESTRLIACCTYADADPVANQWSYSVQASQAAIAVQLHPSTRAAALEPQLALAE
jgi:hypothetical protein